jgi:hypothetical protein
MPKTADTDPMKGVRKMIVRKICVNPRIVEAFEEGYSSLSPVDVGRNSNFAPGDEILVRRSKGVLDLWDFVGLQDKDLPVDHLGLPRDRRRPYR